MRRSFGVVLCGALAIHLVTAGVVAQELERPETMLTGLEMQWFNDRLPDHEQATLRSAVGYAPPRVPEDVWWYASEDTADLTSWDDLKGEVVVVQSWSNATSKGRAAARRTMAILETFKNEPVQLIGLHTPERADRAKRYLDERGTNIPIMVDPVGQFCDELGVYKHPVTIVIDRKGAIRYPGVSYKGLRAAVRHLLDEPYLDGAPAPPVLPARDGRDIPEPPASLDDTAFPTGGPLRGARDVRGKRAPEVVVEKFLTDEPQMDGKVVMVEFWATWCGPCRKNIPHLNTLQERFGDRLVVVAISDEEESKIKGFMDKTEMKYTVARDSKRRLAKFSKHPGIPHAWVISPDGIVRWQGNPHGLTEQDMERIIEASHTEKTTPSRWVG